MSDAHPDLDDLLGHAWFLGRLSRVTKPRLMALRRIKLVRNGVRAGEFPGMALQHWVALEQAWCDIGRALDDYKVCVKEAVREMRRRAREMEATRRAAKKRRSKGVRTRAAGRRRAVRLKPDAYR